LKDLEERLDPQVFESLKNGKLNLNAHLKEHQAKETDNNFYAVKGSSTNLEQQVLFKNGRRYVETLNKL